MGYPSFSVSFLYLQFNTVMTQDVVGSVKIKVWQNGMTEIVGSFHTALHLLAEREGDFMFARIVDFPCVERFEKSKHIGEPSL